MEKIDFDKLTETQFEELCFDLLNELNYVNLSWRKGTGLSSSPSDGGRDIECEFLRIHSNGETQLEKWFVECKHYKNGVPPEKLQSAISWANLKKPDHFLIIVSNFLSNPCKNYIEELKEQQNYKIHIWENPDLRRLLVGKTRILKKYGLVDELSNIMYMHSAHLKYVQMPRLNKLKSLFDIFDMLDSEKRDEILQHVYFHVINPEFENPKSEIQTIGELMKGKLSYYIFQEKCFTLKNKVSEMFLVSSIITYTLQYLFCMCDYSRKDEIVFTNKAMIMRFREDASNKEGIEKKELIELIESLERKNKNIDADFNNNYKLYEFFCNEVVNKMLADKF